METQIPGQRDETGDVRFETFGREGDGIRSNLITKGVGEGTNRQGGRRGDGGGGVRVLDEHRGGRDVRQGAEDGGEGSVGGFEGDQGFVEEETEVDVGEADGGGGVGAQNDVDLFPDTLDTTGVLLKGEFTGDGDEAVDGEGEVGSGEFKDIIGGAEVVGAGATEVDDLGAGGVDKGGEGTGELEAGEAVERGITLGVKGEDGFVESIGFDEEVEGTAGELEGDGTDFEGGGEVGGGEAEDEVVAGEGFGADGQVAGELEGADQFGGETGEGYLGEGGGGAEAGEGVGGGADADGDAIGVQPGVIKTEESFGGGDADEVVAGDGGCAADFHPGGIVGEEFDTEGGIGDLDLPGVGGAEGEVDVGSGDLDVVAVESDPEGTGGGELVAMGDVSIEGDAGGDGAEVVVVEEGAQEVGIGLGVGVDRESGGTREGDDAEFDTVGELVDFKIAVVEVDAEKAGAELEGTRDGAVGNNIKGVANLGGESVPEGDGEGSAEGGGAADLELIVESIPGAWGRSTQFDE